MRLEISGRAPNGRALVPRYLDRHHVLLDELAHMNACVEARGDQVKMAGIDGHVEHDVRVSDLRSTFPRFTPEARTANRPVVDLLARIGAKKNATPVQIALAWLLAQKPWIVRIPGTRKLERLEENLRAVNVELTPDDLREIESDSSQITVRGDRLSPRHLALINR